MNFDSELSVAIKFMKLKAKKRIFRNFANSCLQLSTAFFSLALFLVVYPQSVHAEEFNMNSMPPPEMQMQYSAGALKDGGKLTVWVTIPEKWHVNANEVTDEFLKPSSIAVKAEGIEFGDVVWPTPIKEYNEALELEILTFRGEFKIEIPVKGVADKYDSLGTEATFHYQACDNSICLAPASKTISLSGNSAPAKNVPANTSSAKKNDAEIEVAASIETSAAVNSAAVATEGSAGIIALLLFAFLGGIILNLMPCVLPVLSLKLFSLIKQAGESRGRLLTLGGATTAGILCSFKLVFIA